MKSYKKRWGGGKFSIARKITSIILCFICFTCFFNLSACKDEENEGNGAYKFTDVMTGADVKTISLCAQENIFLEVVPTDSQDELGDLTWTSKNENIAVVQKSMMDGRALVIAKSEGTTKVDVLIQNKVIASINVEVFNLKLNVAVEKIDLHIAENEVEYDLASKLEVSPQKEIKYTSSTPTVASITAEGKIKGLQPGVSTITVTPKGSKQTKEVLVTVHPSAFYSSSEEIILTLGEEKELPIYAKNNSATYENGNSTVVTLNGNKVTANSLGESLITASYNDKTIQVKVQVFDKISTVAFDSTNSKYANFFGRNDASSEGVNVYYGSAGFEVGFYGTKLEAELCNLGLNNSYTPQVQVLVDGEKVPTDDSLAKKITVSDKTYKAYTIVDGLTEGYHTVKVLKRTAFIRGNEIMDAFSVKSVTTDGYLSSKPTVPSLKIEVYGDSITAGYGNLTDGKTMTSDNTNSLLTYHYLAGEILGASVNAQGHSGWGVYMNSAGSTNENIAYYKNFDKVRFNYSTTWNFDNYQPDIVVINLGTNDNYGKQSGGDYDSNTFIANYKAMVLGIRAECPNAKFVLCYGMMGAGLWTDIQAVQTQLEAELGEGIVYAYKFTDTSNWHPLVANHLTNGEALAGFIQDNVL